MRGSMDGRRLFPFVKESKMRYCRRVINCTSLPTKRKLNVYKGKSSECGNHIKEQVVEMKVKVGPRITKVDAEGTDRRMSQVIPDLRSIG